MLLVWMKAAPVKTDGERLGNEFMNGVFFSAQMGFSFLTNAQGEWGRLRVWGLGGTFRWVLERFLPENQLEIRNSPMSSG